MSTPAAAMMEASWPAADRAAFAELQREQTAIRAAMAAVAEHWPGQTEAESQQWVTGFFHVILEAARGETAPLEDYLESVVPSCKGVSMPLGYVLASLVVCAMALMNAAPAAAKPWVIAFGRAYTKRFVALWERS